MTNDKKRQEVLVKIQQLKDRKKSYKAYVMQQFNCSKEDVAKIIDTLRSGSMPDAGNNGDDDEARTEQVVYPIRKGNIIDFGNYMYNEVEQKYIVPLKSLGKNYICPKEQHDGMMAAYSNWKGGEQSLDELSRIYDMPRECIKEYVKIFKWTHDMIPLSDVDVATDNVEGAIDKAFALRKLEAQRRVQKRDWQQTQEEALKWREFEATKLDPFERFIKNYKPQPVPPLKYLVEKGKTERDEQFVIALSDLHFGAKTIAEDLYNGSDFNADVITQIIDDYATKIIKDVQARRYNFKRCVVLVLGDILHTLTGVTVKDTELDPCDVMREAQFKLARTCLNRFFTRIIEIFEKVDIFVVKGNHAGIADWALFQVVEADFKQYAKVSFTSTAARHMAIRLNKNVGLVMEHGASDEYKSQVPTQGTPREAYCQLLFNNKLVRDAKYKIMVQGDKHHWENHEYRGFEFVMFSSPVTGDRYADHQVLYSRPRQSCLIINEEGIKETLHYYFDEYGDDL